MNDTTVIFTRGILKDDGSGNEEMTRSHDTWVLLLVVSVLSTLLCVIVIICCLWFCLKFCLNPSLLNSWRQVQCFPNNQPGFPPNPREFVDMEEISEKIAELKATKVNANHNSGASEHLGYKPGSKNFSLPILPTPRSWTPSPPFPQTSHNQKLNTNHHLSCNNCCKNHCHHCRTHHECFTAFEDASRCQICSFEATRKLSNFHKYCKDIQTPRRPKTEITRTMSYRKSSTFIPGVFEGENSSLGSKKNLPRETSENISENNLSYKKKLQKSVSNKRFQSKGMGKISKRPNTPMVVAQESVSSESSDAASALNRSSGTYWKIFHTKESHNDETKDFGEEDSKYDATEPSMSWDHLAPDLSRSKEEYVEAKAEIDPSRVTAVFHQDKNIEENGSENVNISVQTSSVI
ncbi:hypothetical protein Anas_06834 [Armadillidium nasatum]|uniref:Uncharacterized protein n=1 Tax=Armadillidium nasatum TaxID=96803 RepID=A0A5N5SP61_9CRUS|nr:hypothetical protein Anas_06834 [Armadillidium nasatum]